MHLWFGGANAKQIKLNKLQRLACLEKMVSVFTTPTAAMKTFLSQFSLHLVIENEAMRRDILAAELNSE